MHACSRKRRVTGARRGRWRCTTAGVTHAALLLGVRAERESSGHANAHNERASADDVAAGAERGRGRHASMRPRRGIYVFGFVSRACVVCGVERCVEFG